MNRLSVKASLAGSALLLSACQTLAPHAPDYTQYDPASTSRAAVARSVQPSYNEADAIAPAAGPSSQAGRQATPAYMTQDDLVEETAAPSRTSSAAATEIVRLQERLQRVERAMLRLDRRMQLVERNELNRMSGSDIAPLAAAPAPAVARNELAATNDFGFSGTPDTPSYGDGFQPVSTPITSALQAAPRTSQAYAGVGAGGTANAQIAGLPSLADGPTSERAIKPAVDVAIWTVRFDSDKIWPDRNQLPLSRDVVAMLRENRNITLFARGNKPNSVEFRDRVKALSRYLSKVTSLESVPIATMSAPHLDTNTIEIFASP